MDKYEATYKNVPGEEEPLKIDFEAHSPEGAIALSAGLLLRATGLTLHDVQDVEVEIVGKE